MAEPKLRFKREDGESYSDWCKDKWLNLGRFVSSGILSKADLSEEGTPCILYGELYTKYGEIAHTIFSKTNSSSHIFSKKDDVILPKSGETPEDISTATCIPYDDVSLGGDLIVFRHNEKVIGAFLSYLISNRAKNAIASIAQGKSVVHISEKGLANIELSFPCPEEQQKIADFLSNVDEVIVQSKVEVQNLEQQKKATMQKIFSQEVRFKREDGTEFPEWEINSLSELCDYADYRGKTPTKTQNGIFLVTAKNIKHGYIDYEISKEYIAEDDYETVMHRGVPKIGDVIITTEAPMGNVAQIDRDKIALAQRVIKYRGKNGLMDNDYLKQALLSEPFQDELDKRATGGTVKGIKGSVLHTLILPVPCIEEQQKIADFLSAYDEAISYAKQELGKWKELKKGLLQQMFV